MNIYLFDFDGVIVKMKLFTNALEKEYNIPKSFLDDFFATDFPDCIIGKADLKEKIAPYLESSPWKFGVDALLKFWFEDGDDINTDILKMVKSLKQQGHICCIASNQEKYRKEWIEKHPKIAPYIDHFFFACDLGYKKPDPIFFEAVYQKLQDAYQISSKEHIYFYDDSKENVDAARAFGIDAIHVKNNVISDTK